MQLRLLVKIKVMKTQKNNICLVSDEHFVITHKLNFEFTSQKISYSRVRPSPLRKEQDWTCASGGNQAYLVTISELVKYRKRL